MTKILRGEQLNKFIEEFLKDYKEEVINVVICSDKTTTYIVNGTNRYDIEYNLIEKYL